MKLAMTSYEIPRGSQRATKTQPFEVASFMGLGFDLSVWLEPSGRQSQYCGLFSAVKNPTYQAFYRR